MRKGRSYLMGNNNERHVTEQTDGDKRNGYVPVTPLGPAPQGEPMLAPQTPRPAQTQPQAQTQPSPAPPSSQKPTS